ncbi:sensor domain-containing protein [Marinobacterium rhizophilum]|uniref:sensor domain-containing protein n=1 Tax=Marinobacterium rhizophilum TaxID=420402 RepID=UPI000374D2B6|nr:GGDEF and EAL domain-containing protein [Marinobacterium rhizophilum]
MLHAQADSFYRALTLAPYAVMVISPEGKLLWVNEAFCALSGCAEQDALSRAAESFFDASATELNPFIQLKTAQSRGVSFDIEIPFYPPAGAARWVRLQSQPLQEHDAPPAGFAWFFTDITDERRHRALLRLRAFILDPVIQVKPLSDQLASLADELVSVLPGTGVCVQLLSEDGRRLRRVAQAGLSGGYLDAIDAMAPQGISGPAALAVQRAAPMRVDNIATVSNWGACPQVLLSLGFVTSLSYPVARVGKVLGCIDIYLRSVPLEPVAVDEVVAVAASAAAQAVQLRHDRERLRALNLGLTQANLAMAIMGAQGQVADINECFESQTGFGRSDIVGRHVSELHCIEDAEGGWGQWCRELLSCGSFEGESVLRRKNGSSFVAEITSSALRDTRGEITQYVTVLKDVTERRDSEAMLHQMAFFDPMTGLPNRRLLLDRLDMVLASGRRHRRVSAMIFVDLDHFKRVNDVFGHRVGDAALKVLSQRLQQLVRKQDTVARLGGDEFVVLLPDVGTSLSPNVSRSVRRLADKLSLALREPFDIDGYQHHLQASMGITLLPKGLETAEDLLRQADIALYRSKVKGLGEITFFEAGMQLQVQEFADLERDLRQALRHGELFVFLQPQVNRDGQVVAAEALTRWCHPVRGFIPPAHFIPVAEESGLIVELGAWIFNEVCKLSVRLSGSGHALPVSINISLREFRQAGFVQTISDTLQQTGANPAHLVLEITESLLGDDMGDVVGVMAELARLGLQFSIDDFGTGYSNLVRLKQMPLSELKIDRSFVRDLAEGNNDAAIVEAILGIARSLNLRVVAEGVETQVQADFLRQRGCDRLQGYFYAKPEPAEVVLREWLDIAAVSGGVMRFETKVN